MIVTKTPLRISFFGGGSDIPEFYENNEGIVLSSTINSYIYIAAHRCVAPHFKIIYSELELTDDLEKIKHNLVREALRHFGIESNIEICSFTDVPTKGTGLGSSSTFTVGLINALYRIVNNRQIDHHELAELASYIEINKCHQPIGKQDQYAAAYGGFNIFHFDSNGVRTKHLDVDYPTMIDLNSNLMCFNTGKTRDTAAVLGEQVDNISKGINVELTKSMVALAKQGIIFLKGRKIDDFGNLLDQAWTIKKQLASTISNPEIDDMYEKAIRAGALGGKILGAGGGGYLMMYVPEKKKRAVRDALKKYPILPFKFCRQGSTVEMVQ